MAEAVDFLNVIITSLDLSLHCVSPHVMEPTCRRVKRYPVHESPWEFVDSEPAS